MNRFMIMALGTLLAVKLFILANPFWDSWLEKYQQKKKDTE